MELFAPMDCVVKLQSVSVDIKIHIITVTNECLRSLKPLTIQSDSILKLLPLCYIPC